MIHIRIFSVERSLPLEAARVGVRCVNAYGKPSSASRDVSESGANGTNICGLSPDKSLLVRRSETESRFSPRHCCVSVIPAMPTT
jgi:hypothetical protein